MAAPRRIHVSEVRPGDIPLHPDEARHARDVLRLTHGTPVEVFDKAGGVARGTLYFSGARNVGVHVDADGLITPGDAAVSLTIASAVPKGERADWMVEKLSELGTAEFIPLAAARSVVLPGGKNKRERWARIAIEAAKQSRRAGVMRVAELTPLAAALEQREEDAFPRRRVWYLSTAAAATPIAGAVAALAPSALLMAFIGPEGGWTGEERGRLEAAGAVPVGLTGTILRVETAAVAVAAVVASLRSGARPPQP